MIQVELILEIDGVRATPETEAQIQSEINGAIARLVPPEVIQAGGVRITRLVVDQIRTDLTESANEQLGVPGELPTVEEPK